MSGRHSLLPLAALPDGGWLAEAYDSGVPHFLVRIRPDGRCLTLAQVVSEPGRAYAKAKDFHWTAPDGLALQFWLYRPQGRPKGLIGFIHGSPICIPKTG